MLSQIVSQTSIMYLVSFIEIRIKMLLNLIQAQDSDQFLATTKLATNKTICLKTKKLIGVKCTFKDFKRPITNILL
jgi:hypothetical protein